MGILLTGLTVSIAAIYYTLTLRYTRRNQEISLRNQEQTLKTRNATIYHQILSPVINPIGIRTILLLQANPVSSFEEYQKLRSNNEFSEAWLWMCLLFEMVGIYLRNGVLDIEFSALQQPFWNLWFWRQAKPIIYKLRESYGPSYFRNMEYAFDLLEKYFEEHPELAP